MNTLMKRKTKPGKIRIVWADANTVSGIFMNKNIYTLPDLTAKLSFILFKFREHKVAAVGGDIENMFN